MDKTIDHSKPAELNNKLLLSVLITFLIFVTFSCSLVKIESEQEPIGIRELNTRLLTQNFARTALDRVEQAADSIMSLAEQDKDIQMNALHWKIQTSEALGDISFQTVPRVALLDTWSYCLQVEDALKNPKLKEVFGPYLPIAIQASRDNTEIIEKIALNVLGEKEFDKMKVFVKNFAEESSLLNQKDFKHQSIRESYLEYKNIPDSLAVQTVGTLSEVVADASNRFGYWSNASGKRLNWKTEMMLRERGLDSIEIQTKLDAFDKQVNRLLNVAENSPETIENAIIEFRKNISPLFRELNYEIGEAMQSLSKDVKSVDSIIHRERIALDSIIKRERIALSSKADELVESSIENAFDGISKTLKSLIIYFILLFIVVLGLPFFLGYKLGLRQKES